MPKKSMQILTESMFYVLMPLTIAPMCGTDIAEYIDKKTCGRLKIGPATLYTILGKFEKEKLIRETGVEGRKRTYRITDKGLKQYYSELERLRKCVADAEDTSTNGG